MSGSSNLDSFRDRRQVAVQLVSCEVLPPGLFQDCSQHFCVKKGGWYLTIICLGTKSPQIHKNVHNNTWYHITVIGIMVRGQWSRRPGFNPWSNHPKTQKRVLDASFLYTQHYKVRIKCKWNNSRERIAPSPTLQCGTYWKGSLWVTLDYCRSIYSYLKS